MGMRIKTYVVNLQESTDRREYVLKETAKYPLMDVELIKAVNGKKLTEEEQERMFDRKRFVSNYLRHPIAGEIGCTLSHRKCYETFLASDEQIALILEDDVSFLYPDDTEQVIRAGAQLLEKKRADMVLFISRVRYYTKPEAQVGRYVFFEVDTASETCAYLINRRGAERLLRKDRPFMVADDFKYMRKQGVRIRCTVPHIAAGLSSVQIDTEISGKKIRVGANEFLLLRLWKRILNSIHLIYRRLLIRMGWMVNHY